MRINSVSRFFSSSFLLAMYVGFTLISHVGEECEEGDGDGKN